MRRGALHDVDCRAIPGRRLATPLARPLASRLSPETCKAARTATGDVPRQSTIPYAGTVSRIYPTVEPGTRTFQVEIQVPNPNGELKPGSFAKAAILTRSDPHAITVPLSALVQFAGITKIFLAEEGRAKEVPVVLGTQTTDWVEIVKPSLPTGSLVITSGQMTIASDSVVAIREASFAPTDAQSGSNHVDAPVKPSKAGARE